MSDTRSRKDCKKTFRAAFCKKSPTCEFLLQKMQDTKSKSYDLKRFPVDQVALLKRESFYFVLKRCGC
jgi:hypothetical protein